MNVHPNETRVIAKVKQLTACSDGQGFDVDLEIGENQSPDPAKDFLKPQSGERIQVYSSAQGELSVGMQIQATLGLSAGPFQQRVILRKSEPLKR